MGLMSFLFGKKRGPKRVKRAKRSPGRKPKSGHYVAKLKKGAYAVIRGKRRKLHRGKNGGLYYRTKSGKTYISKKVLKRMKRRTVGKRRVRRSPGKRRVRRTTRKLKQTPAARKARAAYKRRAARMARRMRFGCGPCYYWDEDEGCVYGGAGYNGGLP